MDALTRSMNVPTVNLGMALGLPAITDTWVKLGVPKDQLHPVPGDDSGGALNLTPIEVAQAFWNHRQRRRQPRDAFGAARSVIAEDGTVLYQELSRRRSGRYRRRRRT